MLDDRVDLELSGQVADLEGKQGKMKPLVALAVACTAFVAPPPRGPRWAAPRATPAEAEVAERRVVARVGARGLALRPGESIVAVDYGLRR